MDVFFFYMTRIVCPIDLFRNALKEEEQQTQIQFVKMKYKKEKTNLIN